MRQCNAVLSNVGKSWITTHIRINTNGIKHDILCRQTLHTIEFILPVATEGSLQHKPMLKPIYCHSFPFVFHFNPPPPPHYFLKSHLHIVECSVSCFCGIWQTTNMCTLAQIHSHYRNKQTWRMFITRSKTWQKRLTRVCVCLCLCRVRV